MTPFIQLDSVEKTFLKDRRLREIALFRKPKQVHVLGPLNLTIHAGERVALMGANGSGKTTLLKLLLGILLPSRGNLEVAGQNAHQLQRASFPQAAMVWSREHTFVYQLTVTENLQFFSELHGLNPDESNTRIACFAEALGLGAKLSDRYFNLSTGQKQRVGLMRALLVDPQLLLLDEATRSLDPKLTRSVWSFLNHYLEPNKRTLVFATHHIEEAIALGTRVLVLRDGQIIFDGQPDALNKNPSFLLSHNGTLPGVEAA